MNNKIIQKSAGSKGIGTFALWTLQKGEMVYTFPRGVLLSKNDVLNLSEQDKKCIDWAGDDLYELSEPPACYVNHSCDPNVFEANGTGYALRKIKLDEEITIDYQAINYAGTPFKCLCGTTNCRGNIAPVHAP